MRLHKEAERLSNEFKKAQDIFASGVPSDSEPDEDFFEEMQRRKVDQKFSKLMAFNLDKDFDMIKSLTGKHAQLINQFNKFSSSSNNDNGRFN